MPRLAIISSYNENCGNASYTHVLKNGFSSHLETEVIPLDLFTLQKRGKTFKKLGDDHIKRIAEKLKDFDYVNIQFEAGLYGAAVSDIKRRVSWLIEASKNLIFTMHRIDPVSKTLSEMVLSNLVRLNYKNFRWELGRRAHEILYFDLIAKCKRESTNKNVWICVHTRRERRIVQEYYGFSNCFDHPLVFLTPEERSATLSLTDREHFRTKHGFAKDTKIVGLFGYISAYKGVDTGIKALNVLPDNYILALFGSQHPQTIESGIPIDKYLETLLSYTQKISDRYVNKRLKRIVMFKKYYSAVIDDSALSKLVSYNLQKRIRYMGNLQDPDFIEALRLCDAVVLPYIEVGQSMSGVIALAIESGATMYCANNLSFFEATKYYGDVFDKFDIGNYVELSQKIETGGSDYNAQRDIAYEKYNIDSFIELQLNRFHHTVN